MRIDPFPGTLTRSDKNGHPYVLTDDQQAWLCKWFPEEENSRLVKASRHEPQHPAPLRT